MIPMNETDKKFICAIEENTMIMCEKHAKVFEIAAMMAATPHTIYEMDEDDAVDAKCHACNLQDELTKPKIILPN